jgi:hypothetical protein
VKRNGFTHIEVSNLSEPVIVRYTKTDKVSRLWCFMGWKQVPGEDDSALGEMDMVDLERIVNRVGSWC